MTLILDPDDPAGWREASPAPSAAPSATGSRLTDGLNPEQREAVRAAIRERLAAEVREGLSDRVTDRLSGSARE